MGELITIKAADGHELDAYVSAPNGTPRAALVVLQEIFGVNAHLRAVTDEFAADGYQCIAPSLFDRIQRGITLEHSPSAIEQGIGYASRLERSQTIADIRAAQERVAEAQPAGIIGYCLGGRLAYMAACDLPFACAVIYYGGPIPPLLGRTPRCPVMYHFGDRDKYIPLSEVEQIRHAHPQGLFHVYAAGHGFASDDRPEFDPACAALARRRTLGFLADHLAPAA